MDETKGRNMKQVIVTSLMLILFVVFGGAQSGQIGNSPPNSGMYPGVNVGGALRGQTGTNTSGTTYAADVNVAGGEVDITAGGVAIEPVTDPCDGSAKTTVPINIASATTTELANASASNKMYVCQIHLVIASANNIALVEDDTDGVGSPTAGMAGGTTAASGWNLTGNGITLGNGKATVLQTSVVNRYVGLITSTSAQTSGAISYVLAP